ncbi:MAG TPA: FIST N-terminal domain-containing protein [Candidatus Limnocylindrales bacterium]|jgi:hypothetical protein
MLTMAVGHSDDVDAADAIAAAIAECRAGLGDARPQAGLLVSSFEAFDPSILGTVKAAFPTATIAGATSAAEVSHLGGYQEDSITLALFASDEVGITVGLGVGLASDPERACRDAVEAVLADVTREPRLCIVLANSAATDPAVMLGTIRSLLPDGVTVIGGGSARSGLGLITPTYQFAGDRLTEDGIVLLLFSGPLRHSVAIGMGWKPIGTRGVVTASDHNLLREIDGRPALEFVNRYLDSIGPASFGNPLAIYEPGSDEPYLRVALRGDAEAGTIALIGSVPIGSAIQLTTASADDLLEGTTDALRRAAETYPTDGRPEAALVFSCMVRKYLLGSKTGRETELTKAALPDLPFAGMYCTGEISPIGDGRGPRFLNETFVALLLGT